MACPGPVSDSMALLGLTVRSLDAWTKAFSTTFAREGSDPLSWNSLDQSWPLTTLTPADPSLLVATCSPSSQRRSAGCCQLPDAHEAHRVQTLLSHWTRIPLPWGPCLVDLLVGVSWLQMPDAQSKSYKLFNLRRPLMAVTSPEYSLSLPSASPESGQNKGMFSSRQFTRLHA